MLEHRAAAVHPVAAVDVGDAVALEHRGDMDVALEDLVHYRVLRLGPVHPAAAHRPEVQDVADQEKVLAVVAAQKVE